MGLGDKKYKQFFSVDDVINSGDKLYDAQFTLAGGKVNSIKKETNNILVEYANSSKGGFILGKIPGDIKNINEVTYFFEILKTRNKQVSKLALINIPEPNESMFEQNYSSGVEVVFLKNTSSFYSSSSTSFQKGEIGIIHSVHDTNKYIISKIDSGNRLIVSKDNVARLENQKIDPEYWTWKEKGTLLQGWYKQQPNCKSGIFLINKLNFNGYELKIQYKTNR